MQITEKIRIERSYKRLIAYLRIFSGRAMPEVPDRMFKLLYHKNKDIRRASRIALSNVQSDKVRDAAWEMIESDCPEFIVSGADLLTLNFHSSDATKFLQSLQKLKHPDDIHWAGGSVEDIAVKRTDPSLAPLLLWAHDNQPCANCRSRALKELVKINSAPEQLLFEAQWDCEPDTRILARGALVTFTKTNPKMPLSRNC